MRTLHLHTDGGSRGNPGPAALGVVIKDGDGRVVEAVGEAIGITTNNVAEYRALIRGLQLCRQHNATDVHVHMDSELIVRQMTGIYKIKHPNVVPLAEQVKALHKKFSSVRYAHVPRADNTEADAMVNHALNAQRKTGV